MLAKFLKSELRYKITQPSVCFLRDDIQFIESGYSWMNQHFTLPQAMMCIRVFPEGATNTHTLLGRAITTKESFHPDLRGRDDLILVSLLFYHCLPLPIFTNFPPPDQHASAESESGQTIKVKPPENTNCLSKT